MQRMNGKRRFNGNVGTWIIWVLMASVSAHSAGRVAFVNTGRELAEAIATQDVTTILIQQDVAWTDSDWEGLETPVPVLRNLTVTSNGTAETRDTWPIFDAGFVKDKARLGHQVNFQLRYVVMTKYRFQNQNLAPGLDFLARPLPGDRPSVTCNQTFLVIRACFPAKYVVMSILVVARPAPGDQRITAPIPQPGCVDPGSGATMTGVRLQRQCWRVRGTFEDIVMSGADWSESLSMAVPNQFTIYVQNSEYLCNTILDQQCIDVFGAVGCWVAWANGRWQGPTTNDSSPSSGGSSPLSGGSSPLSGGISPLSGGSSPLSGGISPSSGGISGAEVGAIVGGVVGGVVLLGLLAAALVLLIRRRRPPPRPPAGLGGGTRAAGKGCKEAFASERGEAAGGDGPTDLLETGLGCLGDLSSAIAVELAKDGSKGGPGSMADPYRPTGAYTSFSTRARHNSSTSFPQDPCVVVSPLTPLRPEVQMEVQLDNEVKLLPRTLGKGAFGKVVEGEYQGQRVAVKLLLESTLELWGLRELKYCSKMALGVSEGPDAVETGTGLQDGVCAELPSSLAQEVQVLARCEHPNVVRLLAACLTAPRVCLVMELMDFSLERLMWGNPGELLPLDTVISVALDVARGLEYLHPTIVHRDIKPANVLLKDLGEDASPRYLAKLTDFGLARLRLTDKATLSPDAGTPQYMAPETFHGPHSIVTHKADIYSFGVLLWSMLTGRRPWQGQNAVAVAIRVSFQGTRLPLICIPEGRRAPRLAQILESCWEPIPGRRPAAAEIVKWLMLLQEQILHRNSPTGPPCRQEAALPNS